MQAESYHNTPPVTPFADCRSWRYLSPNSTTRICCRLQAVQQIRVEEFGLYYCLAYFSTASVVPRAPSTTLINTDSRIPWFTLNQTTVTHCIFYNYDINIFP